MKVALKVTEAVQKESDHAYVCCYFRWESPESIAVRAVNFLGIMRSCQN